MTVLYWFTVKSIHCNLGAQFEQAFTLILINRTSPPTCDSIWLVWWNLIIAKTNSWFFSDRWNTFRLSASPSFKVYVSVVPPTSLPSILHCHVCVCYSSAPNNLTHVSEVVSLCAGSQSISCSIEWGKTHKHVDLTVGGVGLLCVHSWSSLCISAGFNSLMSQAENFLQVANSVFPCASSVSLNGKYKELFLTTLFCCLVLLMHDWVSCCLQFNSTVEYVVWLSLAAECVPEVVTNDVLDDGVGGHAAEYWNLIMVINDDHHIFLIHFEYTHDGFNPSHSAYIQGPSKHFIINSLYYFPLALSHLIYPRQLHRAIETVIQECFAQTHTHTLTDMCSYNNRWVLVEILSCQLEYMCQPSC